MSAMGGKTDIARMHGESLRAARVATRIVAQQPEAMERSGGDAA
jgi:hypothetical protein